jgi:hypothetical protein
MRSRRPPEMTGQVAETIDPTGEPAELRDLPPEVRDLVHAVDSMRDHWADADDARRRELWCRVHEASDAVWGREVDGLYGALENKNRSIRVLRDEVGRLRELAEEQS